VEAQVDDLCREGRSAIRTRDSRAGSFIPAMDVGNYLQFTFADPVSFQKATFFLQHEMIGCFFQM
jgi:hypothetical protein